MTQLHSSWLIYSTTVIQLLCSCEGARILAFFPVPAKSHQFVIKPLLDELGKRGHQIVYYSALDGIEFHPNVTYMKLDGHSDYSDDNDDPLYTESSQITLTRYFWNYELALVPVLLQGQAVRDLFNSNEKFDLVLHEAFMASEYVLPFVHKFRALSVVLMGLGDFAWANELAGIPDNPSYMIDWRGKMTDRMTFTERLINSWNLMVSTALNYYYLDQMEKMVHEYARYPGWETRPHLKDLISNNALILMNSHHSVGYNFPKAPHVKEIGGIHLLPNETLPTDVEKFMDEATEGVIYFSMGSIINTKQKTILNLRNHLLNVLSQLKLRALCKLHDDPSASVSKNIMILPWFPQKDILAHKNIKLFISHGGLQSTYEAIHNGVPMITIPFFFDQHKNAKMIAKSGFGLQLNLRTLTNTSLTSAINEVLNNPKYKTEAMRRSTLLKDRPISPLNEAVYWIEYVLKHGNVLQPASIHLSSIQLRQIDIFLFFAFILIVVGFTVQKMIVFVKVSLLKGESLLKKTQ